MCLSLEFKQWPPVDKYYLWPWFVIIWYSKALFKIPNHSCDLSVPFIFSHITYCRHIDTIVYIGIFIIFSIRVKAEEWKNIGILLYPWGYVMFPATSSETMVKKRTYRKFFKSHPIMQIALVLSLQTSHCFYWSCWFFAKWNMEVMNIHCKMDAMQNGSNEHSQEVKQRIEKDISV